MPRALVILPTATYRSADFVAAARALGVDLAVASEALLPLSAADRFVAIDCADTEASATAIADLATHTPIDAIIAADDTGVGIAARAAEMLGIPHTPPYAADATTDKAAMRRLLDDAEVGQPDYVILAPGDDAASAMDRFPGPVVIKPARGSASLGVIKVEDRSAANPTASRVRAIQEAAGIRADSPLLMERFVSGPEVAIEAIAWNSADVEILAVFDKPDSLDGPYFEETIYVTPSRLDARLLADAAATLERAVAALGITNGPIHAELRIEARRPVVIEIANRTIGGLCGRSLRFGLMGTSLEVLVLRQALGMKKSMRREKAAAGVLMVPIPRRGVLQRIDGVDAALGVPGITEFEQTIPNGTAMVPVPEGNRYLAFLFAHGPDPLTVESSLRSGWQALEVVVD